MRLSLALVAALSVGAAGAPATAQFPAPSTGGVVPGIEVLLRDSLHLVRGKRVGLITNPSGRGRDGTSSIDLLFRTPGVKLTALFGPEHGLRGAAQAGEKVSSAVDSATGVPIYSLYDKTRVPTPEMLADVDVLLYDIQDVGARVYTYEWTMALSAAAAKAHVQFIVLDRPDPIRADRVDGNILEPKFASFVGQFPVALRYGLTPGELMRFLVGAKLVDADVRVVPMAGYRRDMWYDQTGLAWLNPSPNIRSPDAALLYPGTVFFEGTNLSEGRGTDAPFQLVGAPWLTDVQDVVAQLNALGLGGVAFEATERTIEAGAKIASGSLMPFIHVTVTDRDRVQPVRVGVKMLQVIHARHPDDFKWGGSIDRLAGTDQLRAAVDGGTVDALLATWDAEAARFQSMTKPYWLYQGGVTIPFPPTFSDSVTTVASGMAWHRMRNADHRWTVNLVTIDLPQCRCALREVRAKDSLVARERVSAMVARQADAPRVLAAINADFFNVKTGENENNQVIGGEWWKGVRVTDSPYDTFDNAHAQFAIGADGKPRMGRYVFDGTVYGPRSWISPEGRRPYTFPLTSLNFLPRGTAEAAVLFTPRYGTTPRDTVRKMAEVRLRSVASRNDSAVYVVAAPPVTSGGNAITGGEVVLAAYGPRAAAVARYSAGDTLVVVVAAVNSQLSTLNAQLLVGGWPRILTNGELSAAHAPWDEGTISSNAEARHPRSAIGFSRDTTRIFLVTVDGRSEDSGGMTLVELAEFMKYQGAWNALNFDGGGSSTLLVRGRVVNAPSDKEGERPVGNALLVVAKP